MIDSLISVKANSIILKRKRKEIEEGQKANKLYE